MVNTSKLVEIVQNSQNIVFFGGAGVSTESGIPDFRSESGLFAAQKKYGHSPEEMLSFRFFRRKTDLFFQYYKENLIHLDVKPNEAHLALSKLEKNGKLSAVVTQNIDGLHQAAGSDNVIELHGTNHHHFCTACGEVYSLEYIMEAANCRGFVPICAACRSVVRPDVVLYGEQLPEEKLMSAINAIRAADCLIVGGTSLMVYPAASLLYYFHGRHLVLINKSSTPYDEEANLVINDSIGTVFLQLMEAL